MTRVRSFSCAALFFIAVLSAAILIAPADAAVGPGVEQQRMENVDRSRTEQERVEQVEREPSVEVSAKGPVAERPQPETQEMGAGAPAEFGVGSSLSDGAERMTLLIEKINVPDDAPISRPEMRTLIDAFEGRETKLTEVIYLTENISRLYASAQALNDLTTAREGFDDADNQSSIQPTTFVISKITVPDNEAVSQDEMIALVKPYEGKELTLAELQAFARNADRVFLSAENISAIAEGSYRPMSGGGYSAKNAVPSARAKRAAAQRVEEAEMPREDVAFQIDSIDITGNTIVPTSELEVVTKPFEGKALKLAEAKEIAKQLTGIYRAKGLITCRAYIPPQKLTDKVLHIQDFEGKVGRVKVQGNRYFDSKTIKRYVSTIRGKVLKYRDLTRSLTKANLHPDREVKAVIVPGKDVGTSDLILDVKDNYPFHIGGEINNFGTKLTGKERYNISIRNTNITGHDDILAGRAQFGEQVVAFGTQYAIPVGDYGTLVGASFNYTDVSIGGDFSILELGGKAYDYAAFINHPIYESDPLSLTLTGSVESKTIDNEMLGQRTSSDELRMIHAGINADQVDPFGRTFLVNDFIFGVPWLGASDKHDARLSRANSGAGFFIYDVSLNRIHPVYNQTYLMLKGAAQLSPDRLVSAEQFDIGGVYSVRGYPQSDYLGDYGMSGSAELRVPFYFIPREYKVPGAQEPLWNRLHLIGFVDGGHAALRNPAVGEFKTRNYVGLGAGVRFDLPKNWVGRVEWAAPIGDDPVDGSNGQWYFTISGDWL